MNKKRKNTKKILLSALLFVLLYALYFIGNAGGLLFLGQPLFPLLYLSVSVGLFIWYFCLCRGFSMTASNPADLPSDWNSEKVSEFLAEEKKRLHIAEGVLTVLVPLIFVFLLDAVDLFFLDGAIALLGSRMFA